MLVITYSAESGQIYEEELIDTSHVKQQDQAGISSTLIQSNGDIIILALNQNCIYN